MTPEPAHPAPPQAAESEVVEGKRIGRPPGRMARDTHGRLLRKSGQVAKQSTGTWVSGRSGNPGGKAADLINVRDLARTHSKTAIKTLVAIMGDEKNPAAARVRAAEVILDRAHGKAPAHVKVSDDRGVQEMTDSELADRVMGVMNSILAEAKVISGETVEQKNETEPA